MSGLRPRTRHTIRVGVHNGVSEQDVAGETGRRSEVMAVTGDISESACRTIYNPEPIAFFTHKMED